MIILSLTSVVLYCVVYASVLSALNDGIQYFRTSLLWINFNMSVERMEPQELEKHIKTVLEGKTLKAREIKSLCHMAKAIFAKEENVTRISAPCTIVGDIHGQFFDLLELFSIGGDIPDANYVFMGDFVDRGFHSVECITLLLLFKVRYPRRICLIRGNHESRQITQVYGFYDECMNKYGSANVWRLFTEVFDHLPLAVLISGEILCLHAGLSPHIETLDDLNAINRFMEIPHEGPMCDMLWSDPDENVERWGLSPRGAGYLFGRQVAEDFMARNGLSLITRSHQLVMEGYKTMFDEKLITVWSAPNYCYRCQNVASILEIDEHLNREFKIFEAVPQERDSTGMQMSSMPYFA